MNAKKYESAKDYNDNLSTPAGFEPALTNEVDVGPGFESTALTTRPKCLKTLLNSALQFVEVLYLLIYSITDT